MALRAGVRGRLNVPDPIKLMENLAMDMETANTPAKMAHFVLQSNQRTNLVSWYSALLRCNIMFENEQITFLTFDDEHHRIAIFQIDDLTPRDSRTCGVHHVAFTFLNLDGLLSNYARLRDEEIIPYRCVNHGMSTSMYYRDPDGNQVELQVDNFLTPEKSKAVFNTESFAQNFRGLEYDPEEFLRARKEGVSVDQILGIVSD